MDAPPTVQFESHEQDLNHIFQTIRDKLEGDQRGEQRKASLRAVEIELEEADDIISQLEFELQGIPQSIKPQYTPRLRQAKADLAKYKKVSKDLYVQLSRSDLLGGGGGFRVGAGADSDDPYGERSDRSRLLVGTEALSDGSRRLADSTSIALATEEQGADILRTLRAQREQIENSRDGLQKADTNIDRASGTIKKMIRQMYKQRFILTAIGVFFVVLIVIILYFKLVRH